MILKPEQKDYLLSPGTTVCTQRSMLAIVLNPGDLEGLSLMEEGWGMSTLLLLKMNSQRAEVIMKVRKQQGLRLKKQANHGTNSLFTRPTKNFILY